MADPVNPSDVIVIDVGGVRFKTLRSTLCKYDDSMLAAMFSGRHAKPLPVDKDGVYFLDRDPVLFGVILQYLRQGILAAFLRLTGTCAQVSRARASEWRWAFRRPPITLLVACAYAGAVVSPLIRICTLLPFLLTALSWF